MTVKIVTISIHALHEESDFVHDAAAESFQSISIHALHEESDRVLLQRRPVRAISIHALHEESDRLQPHDPVEKNAISIHALHEESDSSEFSLMPSRNNFNPRSP